MRRLAGDPRLRDELGSRGYDAFLAKWTREAHLEQYFDLITQTALRKFGDIPWSTGARPRAADDGGGPRVSGGRMASARGSVPVLMYHSISDGSGPTCIEPEAFRRQMAILEETGYRVVSLMDLRGWMRDERELPDALRRSDLRRWFRRLRDGRFP